MQKLKINRHFYFEFGRFNNNVFTKKRKLARLDYNDYTLKSHLLKRNVGNLCYSSAYETIEQKWQHRSNFLKISRQKNG